MLSSTAGLACPRTTRRKWHGTAKHVCELSHKRLARFGFGYAYGGIKRLVHVSRADRADLAGIEDGNRLELEDVQQGETMAASRKRRKAKKRPRAQIGTKKQLKKYTKTAAPDAGPVSLAEARALAHAKQPKLVMSASRKTVAPPASPAAVGAERKTREGAARRVRTPRSRIQGHNGDYEETGCGRPRSKAAKTKGGEAAPEGESFVPLQIFAEGDLWFDYPVPFFGGGIIPRLENRLGVPILNLAKAGDEVRYMLRFETDHSH